MYLYDMRYGVTFCWILQSIKQQIEWNFENKYSPAGWKWTKLHLGKYCLTGVLKILQLLQTCNNTLLVPLLKILIKLWLTTQLCEFSLLVQMLRLNLRESFGGKVCNLF